MRFEILDSPETPLGVLCLRRRELLARPGVVVTEVTLDHELLMSSLHTESERALARLALDWHVAGTALGPRGAAPPRSVLVGGLGLGYTAQEALGAPDVARVEVVERLPEVVGWLRRGLLPLAEALEGDPRCVVREGDVYAELLGPPRQAYDAILIDVDHSPAEPLDVANRPFYTAEGLARVREHLAPGGVLAVWSVAPDARFVAALEEAVGETRVEVVRWRNELIDDGHEVEDVVFLARWLGSPPTGG